MKITFLLSRFLNGGIDTVIVRYLDRLSTTGNSLSLIIGTEYKGLQRFESIIPKNVEVKYLLRESLLTILPKKKLCKKINGFTKAIDAVFFAPIRRILQKTRLKKTLSGTDVIVDFDSTYYSMLPKTDSLKIAFFHFSIEHYHNGNAKKIERLCGKMKIYDRIVLICNKMAEEFANRAPYLGNKVSVIYNPISKAELHEKATEYDVPDEDFIVSVARLEEHQKDFTTLIKAYAHANSASNLPKMYIIGEGRDKATLQDLTRQNGVDDKIVFLGFLPNPVPWIAKAKAFVLSSKFEGLPTVLIEALTLDRVIVSSDCPTGPSEILDNGNCGILVPVGDVNAMADALAKAVSDNELRGKILNNLSQHKHLFSADYCVGKFMELLS